MPFCFISRPCLLWNQRVILSLSPGLQPHFNHYRSPHIQGMKPTKSYKLGIHTCIPLPSESMVEGYLEEQAILPIPRILPGSVDDLLMIYSWTHSFQKNTTKDCYDGFNLVFPSCYWSSSFLRSRNQLVLAILFGSMGLGSNEGNEVSTCGYG